VASAADFGSQQIVTHGKLGTAVSSSFSDRRLLQTKASLNLAITHFDHMIPRLTAELICEYVIKEM